MARGESSVALSSLGRRLLSGYFWLFLFVLYAPTAVLIIFSFNNSSIPQLPLEGFTTQWYRDALGDEQIRTALFNSLKVAIAVSILTTVLGTLTAYPLARRRFKGRNVVSAIVLLPLVVPYVVLGVALLILFRKGPVEVPLGLVAVVFGHIVIALPYTILLLLPRIASIDRRLEEAAHDLGASGSYTFRRVILPLITPAVMAAFLISFVISIDEVVIANFVIGDGVTYPIYLYSGLRFSDRVMRLVTVASLMITVSFVLVFIAEVLRRRGDRRLGV